MKRDAVRGVPQGTQRLGSRRPFSHAHSFLPLELSPISTSPHSASLRARPPHSGESHRPTKPGTSVPDRVSKTCCCARPCSVTWLVNPELALGAGHKCQGLQLRSHVAHCGRLKMVPKRCAHPDPWNLRMSLIRQIGVFADMIELRLLRWGECPGLSHRP